MGVDKNSNLTLTVDLNSAKFCKYLDIVAFESNNVLGWKTMSAEAPVKFWESIKYSLDKTWVGVASWYGSSGYSGTTTFMDEESSTNSCVVSCTSTCVILLVFSRVKSCVIDEASQVYFGDFCRDLHRSQSNPSRRSWKNVDYLPLVRWYQHYSCHKSNFIRVIFTGIMPSGVIMDHHLRFGVGLKRPSCWRPHRDRSRNIYWERASCFRQRWVHEVCFSARS